MKHGTAILACCVTATPVVAQQQKEFAPVDSGKVVRFEAGGGMMRGRLLAPLTATADSVPFCRFPGPPCQGRLEPWQLGWVRPDALQHLDVQVGTRAEKGAWIGGVIGVVLTFAGATLANGFCEYQCPSDARILIGSIVWGGLWGGGLGALIGSGSPRMEAVF